MIIDNENLYILQEQKLVMNACQFFTGYKQVLHNLIVGSTNSTIHNHFVSS